MQAQHPRHEERACQNGTHLDCIVKRHGREDVVGDGVPLDEDDLLGVAVEGQRRCFGVLGGAPLGKVPDLAGELV